MAFLVMLLCAQAISAQILVVGRVTDAQTKQPMEGVQVSLEGTGMSVLTPETGAFNFSLKKAGLYRVQARMLGYVPFIQTIHFSGENGETFEINLTPKDRMSEEVIISATRSKDTDPTTALTVTKEDLEKVNLGQDLPVLLQMTPSVITTSDAGGGVGYTGINIRGSDATRINVTINGIPLNDAESQGVFWVNMPDFATSVSSIQIQRGVGTSTNGPSAFGASLNVQTNTLEKNPTSEASFSGGSFGTWKSNIRAGSGLINNRFTVDMRLSRIASNGFIDRASSDLSSSYISAGYYGKKGLLKFNLIHGSEQTYQAWSGIPESRLNGNVAAMQEYADRNGLSLAETQNLLQSSSRTYNPFTYKGQTDNYKQTHYQLLYSTELKTDWNLNAALFYTRGAGYYEEFKSKEKYSNYGMTQPIIGGDTLLKTDLIRQRGLDNHFYGTTYSLQYQKEAISLTFGGLASQYRGMHFGDVIWAKVSNLTDNAFRYYENDGLKSDFTNYLKLNWNLTTTIAAYADVQVRGIQYKFQGYDRNLNSTDQSVEYLFFNPKAGISAQLTEQQQVYMSYGKSSHEPARVDFVNSSPESRPKAEILHNVELGWRWKGNRSHANVNYYLMYYKDQLVLTGQINDVGAYIRSNVDESYRMGIEAEASFDLGPNARLFGNITISRNRILSYKYYLDDYDEGGQRKTSFKETSIAFSPDLIAAAGVSWQPIKNWETSLESKWVGRQYLDNTGDNAKSIKPYQFLNLRSSYKIPVTGIREWSVQFMVNNLLDSRYENNGYTYGYVSGGSVVNENFFFPSAGRNFLAGINVKF